MQQSPRHINNSFRLSTRQPDVDLNEYPDLQKVLRLKPVVGEASRSEGKSLPGSPPDWSAALDLIHQAADVIKVAEDQVKKTEARAQHMARHALDDLRAAQVRIDDLQALLRDAETRATEAEARAKDAEEWLTHFHDTIMQKFSVHVRNRSQDPNEDVAA